MPEEFRFMSTKFGKTKSEIVNMLVADWSIDGEEGPIPTSADLSDEMAQQFINEFVDALYDTAEERMVHAQMDLTVKYNNQIERNRKQS